MRKYLLCALSVAALAATGPAAYSQGTPSMSTGGYSGGSGGYSRGTGVEVGTASTTQDSDAYTLAKRLLKKQQYAAAISPLGSALADKPTDPDILSDLGYAHRMVGQGLDGNAQSDEFKYALAYYGRAETLDPNRKDVHQNLGELYVLTHNQASAATEMKALDGLCPAGCDERDALGVVHIDMPATPERVWRALREKRAAA